MSNIYIDLGKKEMYITLTDDSSNITEKRRVTIPTQLTDKTETQDACDWWVICASSVRAICELHPAERVNNIYLSGNKDGCIQLDELDMPLCAAQVSIEKMPDILPECKKLLSPVSYLRFMLTGEYICEESELIVKYAEGLPDSLFGKVRDMSLERFPLSKEAAFLMRLKRPVIVNSAPGTV